MLLRKVLLNQRFAYSDEDGRRSVAKCLLFRNFKSLRYVTIGPSGFLGVFRILSFVCLFLCLDMHLWACQMFRFDEAPKS